MNINETQPLNNCGFGRIGQLLEKADLSLNRFIHLNDGTKQPRGKWNTHPPTEVGNSSLIETGNGLLVIDIDDWDKTTDVIRDFLNKNPTLQVHSPHATGMEGHWYYQIDEAPFSQKEIKGDWGEAKHGMLVVTPGSEITECKHGCCTPESPGKYEFRHERSITHIDELPLSETQGETQSSDWESQPSEDLPTFSVDEYEPEFNPNERLEYARKCNENLDSLCEWAQNSGSPSSVGYSGRSEAERALTMHLAFWFERNRIAVRNTLHKLNPPKWDERGDNYRKSVLGAVDLQSETYSGFTGPSGPSEELTLSVWMDLYTEGPMSTKEVAESVEYSDRQTWKALDFLDERDFVDYEREGRSGKWVIREEMKERLYEIEDGLISIEEKDRFLMNLNKEKFGFDSRNYD